VNKVVARYVDGRVLKGSTGDFTPAKEAFHVAGVGTGEKPTLVRVADLKAIFFVKDLAGNPKHEERKAFDAAKPPVGRAITVEFRDGEVLVGTTQGYEPHRPGFFVVPADPTANNLRCYIVAAAVRGVTFPGAPQATAPRGAWPGAAAPFGSRTAPAGLIPIPAAGA